jgi:hypothetical protein
MRNTFQTKAIRKKAVFVERFFGKQYSHEDDMKNFNFFILLLLLGMVMKFPK